jgi:predicted RNA methylase
MRGHPFLNSPEKVAETLRPIIEGKVVCDVGCRSGVFMERLSLYAKEVFGIEVNGKDADIAKEKGFNVIQGDARTIDLPDADVYYVWVAEPHLLSIIKRITKGIVVVGSYLFSENKKITEYLGSGVQIDIPNLVTESGYEKTFRLTVFKQHD